MAAPPTDRSGSDCGWIELVAAASRKRIRLEFSAGNTALLEPSADLRPARCSDVESPQGAGDHVGAGAQLRPAGPKVVVTPFGGCAVAVNGVPVHSETHLDEGDWLAVGDALLRVDRIRLRTRSPPGPRGLRDPGGPPAAARGVDAPITIGRLPDNSVPIPSPVVSRRHARLVREAQGWVLEDLGSTNGTFVDGCRVRDRRPLAGGEQIQIGQALFRFRPDASPVLVPSTRRRGIQLECRALGKTVRERRSGRQVEILAGIDLVIEPGEFVGIFGTSGSGKSTLLDALSARRPATSGAVFYDGRELAASFDMVRCLIGYVPQQDIVHRGIPVARALRYTARLRLPPDTSEEEIDARIHSVLGRIGLADKAEAVVDTPAPLSGGQLKRVSVAVELVSEPSVLFLDEVTSGLDAATDLQMMELFRGLATEGRTVVCVTHTLEHIDLCDHVVLLHGGRLAFFGPPALACRFFGVERLTDVYERIRGEAPEHLARRYGDSTVYQQLVAARRKEAAPAAVQPRAPAPRRPYLDFRQVRILTCRYVDLLLGDRGNLAILLCQAPLVALVIGLVFDVSGPEVRRAAAHRNIGLLAVIASIWFGCLNSAREIVKERPIYERERAVNLHLGSYLASKVGPLSLLAALQSAALLGVLGLILPLSLPLGGSVGVLFLTNLAAVGMGLVVSAAVGSADRAVAAVPILLVPQIVLADAIVELAGPAEWVARLSAISYWSFAAIQDLLSAEFGTARNPLGQPLLRFDFGTGEAAAALVGFFSVFVGAAAVALRVREPRR